MYRNLGESIMDEWNAIDLHMHTCVGVTGDGNYD